MPKGRQLKLEPLTPRQAEVYCYIRKRILIDQLPPTIREIGRHFGTAYTNGMQCHLGALERKGYIRRAERTPRGIVLVPGPASLPDLEGVYHDFTDLFALGNSVNGDHGCYAVRDKNGNRVAVIRRIQPGRGAVSPV